MDETLEQYYDINVETQNFSSGVRSRDLMADFIHHPNEWGHKLYLTSIIDVFNINGEMRPVDLPDYVYVE